MKILVTKILIIFLFLATSQVFAKEECEGTDVSKWNNCIGETKHPEDERGRSKGPYKNGKKHGLFWEDVWVYREEISSDGYWERGRYVNGKRQGIWGYCYMRQVSYTYFMIGNYNDQGERDGPWGEFNSYEQDFVDGSNGKHDFPWEGCHVETALYYLNKEEPCSDKKTPAGGKNLFTNIDVYKNGKVIHSGEFCNHPLFDTRTEYKDTSIFKKWVTLLEKFD